MDIYLGPSRYLSKLDVANYFMLAIRGHVHELSMLNIVPLLLGYSQVNIGEHGLIHHLT